MAARHRAELQILNDPDSESVATIIRLENGWLHDSKPTIV